MNWIKSAALLILFSILTLKAVDLLFSFFYKSDVKDIGTNRNVILKEHNQGFVASLVPDDNYLSTTETLEKSLTILKLMKMALLTMEMKNQSLMLKYLLYFLEEVLPKQFMYLKKSVLKGNGT